MGLHGRANGRSAQLLDQLQVALQLLVAQDTTQGVVVVQYHALQLLGLAIDGNPAALGIALHAAETGAQGHLVAVGVVVETHLGRIEVGSIGTPQHRMLKEEGEACRLDVAHDALRA